MLPAEGVKMLNSAMVKVEGVEQEVALLAGSAEERADKARTREAKAIMILFVRSL